MQLFEVGKLYRVRKSFTALRSEFRAGELLTYQASAYSRYDGITGYFFLADSQTARSWDVYDGDTPNADELFEDVC
jgi:hypothetical protein